MVSCTGLSMMAIGARGHVVVVLATLLGSAAAAHAGGGAWLVATYEPEPPIDWASIPGPVRRPPPSSDVGASGQLAPPQWNAVPGSIGAAARWWSAPPGGVAGGVGPTGDRFIADGAETGLAINIGDPLDAAALLNRGFPTTPSLRVTNDGNGSWITKTFPNGSGTYTGAPFDPWAVPGNAPGEIFGCLIRRSTTSGNAHCVVGRSINSGATWTKFFEEQKEVFQDRQMFDLDRSESRGGGAGSTHDGKVYLFYDDFGPSNAGYVESVLQVVDAAGGAGLETAVSTLGGFIGNKWQPLAGVTDGQFYAFSVTYGGLGGDINVIRFHEFTDGGGTVAYTKSGLTWARAGQEIGTSSRWCLNGHRIGFHGDIDIDRTQGPRRGHLYYLTDRNPNQASPSGDQGTLHLSISTNGAASWSTATIPGQAAGKTQYFAMIDVDDNGWIHVGYYQNEAGVPNGGVLNASTANVYYTYSTDGGATWAPHIQVNSPDNTLDFFNNPPLDLANQNYYLIGDYQTLRAAGTGSNTVVYLLWTGYDKDRSDVTVNNKRERVICTKITGFTAQCPADLDGDGVVDGADLGLLLGAWGGGGAADLDASGTIDGADLGLLLGAWGPCEAG